MFTVTRDWIMLHRTPNRAWRRAQIEAIGVPFDPPFSMRAGWIDRIEGAQITDEQKREFEQERIKHRPEQQGLFDQIQTA